jgi:hypothetical protein
MCENCDPGALQPAEPEANIPDYLETFKFKSKPYIIRFPSYLFLIPLKLIITFAPLLVYKTMRTSGQRESRPGPGVKESEATYPYSYDELGPEFDQDGRGIFFLQAGIEGTNAKNLALRQYFEAFGPWLIQLAVAGLALCFAETASLAYIIVTTRRSSPLNTGEWHHHLRYQQEQNKKRSLWRKLQAGLSVLYYVAPPVAQLSIFITIVNAEVRLANSIRADPVISAYLDRIRTEYPRITPEMIQNSLTGSYKVASAILAVESLYAVLLVGVVVCLKSGLGRRRRPVESTTLNTVGERSVWDLSEEEQVTELAKCDWEDTGPLARAYKSQLDRVDGGAEGTQVH